MSYTQINKSQTDSSIYTQDSLVAGTNISITQVPQPIINEHTLGVWHFDGDGNNAVNGSSYGAIDTSYVSTDYSKFGTGSYKDTHTDSTNRSIITFTAGNMSANFTCDMWVRQISSSANYISRKILLGSYGYLTFANGKIGTGTFSDTVPAEAGTWHHIAFERKDNTLTYYIDGVLYKTISVTRTDAATLQIEQSNSAGVIYIDELCFSNVAKYNGNNFTPFSRPYAYDGTPQYAINNTQVAPDLSNYLQNTATGTNNLTVLGTATTQNNAINIGTNSQADSIQCVSIGNNSRADGNYSLAVGTYAYVVAGNSVAIGSGYTTSERTEARRSNSVAVGYNAHAITSGSNLTAVGASSIASNDGAVALGSISTASGSNAIAIGGSSNASYKTEATNSNTIAIGYNAKATTASAIQLGTGTNSTSNTFQVKNTTLLDANNKVPLSTLPIVQCTQSEYDALVQAGTIDPNTLYIIQEESN